MTGAIPTVGAGAFRFGTQVFLCFEAPAADTPLAVEHDGTPVPLSGLGRMRIGAFDLTPGVASSTLRVRVGDGPWAECRAKWLDQ